MNRLKELRAQNNLTQKAVARAVGITTSYYGMIELGVRKPSLSLAMDLARFFGTSVEEIFVDL
ncbi:helix-turn-helix transcriptional regulator [Intestinibacter sp.]|uniref:helix-turn-helix transcriptional regulator n=1 Tax=Intestinibacter sp. TaxID=1965304 RepID=UPI003F185351